MEFGLAFACLNALCQAIMVKFDQLMMGNCYQDKWRMAWLVSVIFGTFLGILTMVAVWVFYTMNTGESISTDEILASHSDGIWMIGVGVLTTIGMGSYFYLFKKSDSDVSPDVTTISMWLASTPIWVAFASFFVVHWDIDIGPLESLSLGGASPLLFFCVILLTTIAIIWFDAEGKTVPLTWKRGAVVALMVTSLTSYVIIASAVLYGKLLPELLALQPYYWIGFFSGVLLLFWPGVWGEMLAFKSNFFKYWKIIIIAEVIGVGVYIFEMYALWQLTGMLANLINSGHVILVFLLGYVLSYAGSIMIRNKQSKRFGDVVLTGDMLLFEPASRRQLIAGALAVACLGAAILVSS